MQESESGRREVEVETESVDCSFAGKVGDQRFMPRGAGLWLSSMELGCPNVKVRAIPASDMVSRKGTLRRSTPREMASRISCGVQGEERQRRGRSERVGGIVVVVEGS